MKNKVLGYGVLTKRGELLPGVLPVDRPPTTQTINDMNKYFKRDAPHTVVELVEYEARPPQPQ